MSRVKTAVWQQWDNIGLEYLQLTESDEGLLVDSVVIGIENKIYFRLHYQIRCASRYQVQRVDLDLAGHTPVTLTTDGAGHWFDKDNQPLPALDGCNDIDISVTPFTNTLPIRRLEWQPCQSQVLHMVYIRIPELTIERATQRYTCLEKNEQGALFEYSQPNFKAILPVDADGFVQNYPELFRRLT